MTMRPDPVPISIERLVSGLDLGAELAPADGRVTVTGLTHDSTDVVPGDVFVALPGRTTHGARFTRSACLAGAAAIITDAAGAPLCAGLDIPVVVVGDPRRDLGVLAARAFGRPADDLAVLAVTGTNGKTTVAAMVEAGLRAGGVRTGVIGTTGIRIDGTSHPLSRTTPEASDLHGILGHMRQVGVRSVVMEVSSIAVAEHRVDGITFDVAAFTNLSLDHLDYHGSMSEYFAAKAALFTDAHARRGIVGIDDEWGRRLRVESTVPTTSWSLVDPHADWHLERAGHTVVVGPDGEREELAAAMPGAFNLANAVVAFAMLVTVGVSADVAAAGIATARVPGRMQVVGQPWSGDRVLGIVDYAHSPDAVSRVLRAARELGPRRVIAVIGAGGDRDRGKRPQIGSTAARLADVVVVTDDNPRSEDPAAIRREVLAGADNVPESRRAEIHDVADREQAITVAVGAARAGDCVLVLGKGHEQGQEVAGVVTPFDDATALRAALASREGR